MRRGWDPGVLISVARSEWIAAGIEEPIAGDWNIDTLARLCRLSCGNPFPSPEELARLQRIRLVPTDTLTATRPVAEALRGQIAFFHPAHEFNRYLALAHAMLTSYVGDHTEGDAVLLGLELTAARDSLIAGAAALIEEQPWVEDWVHVVRCAFHHVGSGTYPKACCGS